MKVASDVLAVLDQARVHRNALFLVGQLDRNLYERTNKVLESAGGRWKRKEKAHIFDCDAAEAVEQIILTGEITVPQDFGFFPTPAHIVDRLIHLADITPGMTVLEPSAGTGNIIAGLQAAGAKVDAIELLDKNAESLQKQGLSTIICIGDFLETNAVPTYDRVVMNPPFSKQADIKHVLHALKFLKPGGMLVSVMSAGITFRTNSLASDFRSMLLERAGTIENLPEGSFKESGTNVSTVIVSIPAQDSK